MRTPKSYWTPGDRKRLKQIVKNLDLACVNYYPSDYARISHLLDEAQKLVQLAMFYSSRQI